MKVNAYTRLDAAKKITATDAKLVSALNNVASGFSPSDDDAKLYFAGAVDLAQQMFGYQKVSEALAELLIKAGINKGIDDYNDSQKVDFDEYCDSVMSIYREGIDGLPVKRELAIYITGLDILFDDNKEDLIFELLYNSYK